MITSLGPAGAFTPVLPAEGERMAFLSTAGFAPTPPGTAGSVISQTFVMPTGVSTLSFCYQYVSNDGAGFENFFLAELETELGTFTLASADNAAGSPAGGNLAPPPPLISAGVTLTPDPAPIFLSGVNILGGGIFVNPSSLMTDRVRSTFDVPPQLWETVVTLRFLAGDVIDFIFNSAVVIDDVAVDAPKDIDEDGVPDADDNCPAIANADQQDSNLDGIGDACQETVVFGTTGFLQANLDGSTGAEATDPAAGEPPFEEQLVRIVDFRFTSGLTDSPEALTATLVAGAVELNLVSPDSADALIQSVIEQVCDSGSISGVVTANCPVTNTGLLGVSIDAFKNGAGDLVGAAVTDVDGQYQIDGLTPGDYTLTIVAPLGYSSSAEEVSLTIGCNDIDTVDFALTCVEITANPRTIGFWKHQLGVALGGTGHAHVDDTTLCNYLDLIEGHFNNNEVNQVIIYQSPSPSATCTEKLQVAKELLNLKGSQTMLSRAKQQLLALLLNVAAGHIHQTEVISEDGATVSQAITYSDNLIDDALGDHETAKTICDEINNNRQVAAGVIPLSTDNIAYKDVSILPKEFSLNQNYPNPFNPSTKISLSLPEAANWEIVIYNIRGQKVSAYSGFSDPGVVTIDWDGSDYASGVYFYKATVGEFSATRKMVLLK
ncbi:MAG: T9SS type A sorting domain-containing protein [candidate division Zixibacteria bacterium]|nr:T9SS type A sorting domain-containing protein [candidate division Zixibacteria bacterium]